MRMKTNDKPSNAVCEVVESMKRYCAECGAEIKHSGGFLFFGADVCSSCWTKLKNDYQQKETRNHSHYYKPVGHLQTVDWYRICDLFEITDSALAHAGKKIAFAGKRGAKDQRKDIQEAIDTLLRRLAMMDEDEKA